MKKLILKHDIVIPAGTEFTNIDGRKSEYIEDNYSHLIGLTSDSCGEFIYGYDELDDALSEWFDVEEE